MTEPEIGQTVLLGRQGADNDKSVIDLYKFAGVRESGDDSVWRRREVVFTGLDGSGASIVIDADDEGYTVLGLHLKPLR